MHSIAHDVTQILHVQEDKTPRNMIQAFFEADEHPVSQMYLTETASGRAILRDQMPAADSCVDHWCHLCASVACHILLPVIMRRGTVIT